MVAPPPEPRNAALSSQLFNVKGLSAVVTGGASGLGLAIARVLARSGAHVTIVDVCKDVLAATRAEAEEEGILLHTSAADVADHASIERALAEVVAREGGLHIVFANAGITAGNGPFVDEGKLANLDLDRWRRVLDVNLTGVLNTMRAASMHMHTGYGRIIVTSSVAGIAAEPTVGYAYAAAKSAVIALTRNASIELAPRGILVNAIAPGPFTTNLGSPGPGRQKKLDALRDSTLLGRIADTSEIEGIALYLASPASSYATGAVFSIDGGAAINRRTFSAETHGMK